MHVDIRKSDDVVVVDLQGKLSAGLGDQILHDTIDELLAENWRKILLNLSEITFIDSAGIGELVSGLKTAQHLGARLKIVNTNERVHSTQFITRLLPLFDVYRDEQEALLAFSK
jgi:anti-sigma B factor antagonist